MLNNASKFALGLTGIAVVAAIFADDRAAAITLVGLALAAAIVSFGIARTVGADLAPFVAADATPASSALEPSDVGGASFGPLLVAIGVTVLVAAGALGSDLLIIGGLFAVTGTTAWLFDTYRSGVVPARDAANVDNRFLGPLGLPALSLVTALTIAYSFSRVLLAVSETASWVIALVVGAVLFGLLYVIAEKRPKTQVLSGLAGIGAVATLVVGGTFAGVGEREFHHAGEEIPTVEIVAKNIAFDRKVIGLPADTEVKMIFDNLDVGTFHNVAIYTADEPGTPIYSGQPSSKGVLTYRFETPNVGTYRYICDFHPAMVGELRVTEGVATDEHESTESSDHASDEKESEH